tara:strand:+ start:3064 stop:6780 length:3717 start_codon:yes stop_codon:yes gene_type:complete
MTSFNLLIISVLALFVASCGGKKATTNTTLVLGGVINSIVGQDGGTMIYGRQLSGGNQSFALKLPFNQDLELPNGRWNFSAISWDGDSSSYKMEGVTRCGVNVVELLGGEQSVNLVLSTGGCAAQFFGDDKSKEANSEPKKFQPVSCAKTDSKDNRIDKSDCPNSVAQSFTIELLQKGLGGQYFPGLASRCIAESTAVTAEMDHAANLRVPMFLPTGFDNTQMKLTAYEDVGCTQSPQETIIYQPLAGAGSRPVELDSDGTFNDFYFFNAPCEGIAGTGGTPFSFAANKHIICNTSQIAGYVNSNPTSPKEYFLGQDIDFSSLSPMTTSVVPATFSAIFDGQNFSILGLGFDNVASSNTAMFTNLVGGTIRNIKLSSPSMTVTSADVNNISILAASVSGSSNIENISMTDVSVSVTFTAANGNNVGSVVGNLTGGNVRKIFINGLNLFADKFNNVGGIVGYAGGSTVILEDSHLKDAYFTVSNSTASSIGGAIGRIDSQATARYIEVKNINFGTNTTATGGNNVSQVGGVVGHISTGASLLHSRVTGLINTPGSDRVGGVAGMVSALASPADVLVYHSLSALTLIKGNDSVGGVVGYVSGNNTQKADMFRSRYEGISAESLLDCLSNCGGLIGALYNSGHIVNQSYVKNAKVKASGGATISVAGLIGFLFNDVTLAISSSFAKDVTVETTAAAYKAGGLIGENWASGATYSINDSYFDGSFVGTSSAGLIAYNSTGATINRTFGIDRNPGVAIGSYNTGTPTTWTNHFANISGPNTANVGIGGIEDSSTLNGGGFLPATWKDITISGSKELLYEDSYESFANTGVGTRDSPFHVSSVNGWNAIGDKAEFMGGHFKLGLDLDFDSLTFKPIASTTNPFFGSIDGDGKVIKNIVLSESVGEPTGLVRVISTVSNANARNPGISNLTLSNVDFESDQDVGGFVGKILDDATNVNFGSYAVHLERLRLFNSTISQVGASSSLGGVAGVVDLSNGQTRIRDIIVQGSNILTNSSTAANGAGGVFGKFDGTGAGPTFQGRFESIISDSNLINVTTAIGTGGVLGVLNNDKIEFRKIISNNTVTGVTDVGGVVGRMDLGIINDAYSKGSVTGTTNVGGFVGRMTAFGNEVQGSYSTAAVSGTTDVAGFAGRTNGVGKIENSWSAPSSLVGSAFEGTGDNPMAATKPLVYVGLADDGFANTTFVSDADLKNPANLGVYFNAVDPFVYVPGDYPRPYFEVFPQYFLD